MSKHVGAVWVKDAKMLSVGAFVEGELYLSWMHFFQAHSLPFILHSFIVFCSRANEGTLPWRSEQW
jgi:hypothetical protein